MSNTNRETLAVMGEAHGALYVELEGARAALNSALKEVTRLQEACGKQTESARLDRETIQTILDLLNPLHGSLDKQTYDERYKEGFDAPGDAEYEVTVTAQQERDLTQAVVILESRLRDLDLPPPKRRAGTNTSDAWRGER